ncbi:MAG: TolC family protein [Bacteroidales bacterium]|nr:TolC family protein [Bacteroidales bacterium]
MKALLLAIVLQSWSLGECIDYALEHNLSVRQGELGVQQKEISLNTAKNRRLPGLAASASENFSFGRGLTADNTYSNANTTSTSFQLGADLPLFQGFDIKNDIRQNELNLAAATADLEKAKDDIRVAVAQAYVQILYNQELLEVARGQVAQDSLLLERIEAMCEAGKASSAEVSAQKATLAQSHLNEVQAEGNLELALLDLSQLLELDSPEGFSVKAPSVENLQVQLLMSPEEVFAEAVNIKPAIRSGQLKIDFAQAGIDRAKGAYLPSLSLSSGIGTNYYTNSRAPSAAFGDQLRNNFSQYIGISLRVPIFSRMSTRNSVRTAELNLEGEKLQLETLRKTLYKEIQQAYYNAVNSQAQYRSSEQAARSAEESLELVRAKYETGKATSTEYNESRKRYLEAESNFLQSRYRCLYQTKLIDFYRGVALDF